MLPMTFFSIVLAGILTNNAVLYQGIGICSYVSVTNKTDKALKLGLATTFVLVCSVMLIFPINLALEALKIEYLRLIVSIIIIAAFVQMTEFFIKKTSKRLYESLGIYLPLITTNCLVLGTTINVLEAYSSFGRAVLYALSIGLGFILALVIMASVRQKTDKQKAPAAAVGFPLVLIIASLIAMAFEVFKGF